ncbi:MAG: hypothetical protein WCY22_03240 [Acholeplasmataceae bacterium]
MSKKDRMMVLLSSYFWATLGLFFTGTFWFFLLPVFAMIFTFFGGKKHV